MGSAVSIIVFGFMTSPSSGFCGCCLGPDSWENGLLGGAAEQKLSQHPDTEATGASVVPRLSAAGLLAGIGQEM